MYSRETELRHIQSTDVYKLGQILDPNNSWKKLMQIIPKEITSEGGIIGYKYNNDHIRLVENESIRQVRLATEILFDEWGTSGKRRPTLGVLLELLVQAELFRAADMVAVNLLNEPPPERPTKGPAAKIDISIPLDSEIFNGIADMLDNGFDPGTETLLDNANLPSLVENKDYYTKYERTEKELNSLVQPIPPPRAIKQSRLQLNTDETTTNYANVNNDQPQGIPRFSQLLDFMENSTSTDSNFGSHNSNELYDDSKMVESMSPKNTTSMSAINVNTESTDLSDIPMLSVLGGEEQQEVLPVISALNLNIAGNIDEDKITTNTSGRSISRTSCNTSDSSDVEDDDDDIGLPDGLADFDDEDNSVRNQSLIDQRSSNNDSSLTNITGTSGDNSFELCMNDGSFDASNDNIPHLSILQQQ